MKPIRVLHIIAGMGSGGAESYIMNMYRHVDRTKVQFDFLLRSHEIIYKDEIETLGGKVFYTASFPRNFLKNTLEVSRFFASHPEYQIIHVHGNALIYITPLILGKLHGIPCRIMHSHNTRTRRPIYAILHHLNKLIINTWATDCFACSTAAGHWMFNNTFTVMPNAVNVSYFASYRTQRENTRKELGIDNKFVLGNIARFLPSKNHTFLINLFAQFKALYPQSILLLVGAGETEPQIRQLVKSLNLEDSVQFLGIRKDIPKLIQTFDVMLLPSQFEGLPVVLVEAQAGCIPCVISDNITDEVSLTPLIQKLSLESPISEWIAAIESANKQRAIPQSEIESLLTSAGFDSSSAATNLQEFYLSKDCEKPTHD